MGIFTFIADQIVDQIEQYKKQADTCDRVVSIIRNGLNPIQGGAWIGEGARAYIGEIVGKVIPHIMELIAAISGFGGGMGKALNIIQGADKAVSGVVGQLADAFDSVF